MIWRIILILLLLLLTSYCVIIINIWYTLWIEQFLSEKIYNDLVFYVAYVGPIILLSYLLYILVHGFFTDKIYRMYGYVYLFYLILLVVFYILFVFSNNKLDFITDNKFDTKLQHIEVLDKNNWLLKLLNFLETNEEQEFLLALYKQSHRVSKCIYSFSDNSCNTAQMVIINTKGIELSESEIENLEIINWGIDRILDYEYFKQSPDSKDPLSFKGLSSLVKANLFYIIYNMEQWNIDKVIEIISLYNKLWEKLLTSDSWIIPITTGINILQMGQYHTKFILENYSLEEGQLKILRKMLINNYNWDEIYQNTIHHTYQSGLFIFDKTFRDSIILLNKDEFYNELRDFYQWIVNKQVSFYDNYDSENFKNNSNDYFFENIWNISFKWYKDDILNLNIKDRELITDIDLIFYHMNIK